MIQNIEGEIWRPIKDYEGLYEVSNCGRVKSIARHGTYERLLKLPIRTYKHVFLSKNGNIKMFLVHRLVASAFIQNPHNYNVVNHIDENKLNNNATNLEWCTAKQNLEHSKVIEKFQNAAHKSNEKKVVAIDKNGKRTIFDSLTKAAEFVGGFQQNVSSCCKDSSRTYYGYKFEYITKVERERNKPRAVAVYKGDKLLFEFESISLAARTLLLKKSMIFKNCKCEMKTYKCLIFKFI